MIIMMVLLCQQPAPTPWELWSAKIEHRVTSLEKFQIDGMKLANEAQSEADMVHADLDKRIKKLEDAEPASVAASETKTDESKAFPWYDMLKDGTLVTLITGIAAGLYRTSGRVKRTEEALSGASDTKTPLPTLIEVPGPK